MAGIHNINLINFLQFTDKLSEAARTFTHLRAKLCEAQQNGVRQGKQPNPNRSYSQNDTVVRNGGGNGGGQASHRHLKHLKFAFSEFYLMLVYLQSYQHLNFTGFRKILKKYDKILHSELGARWRIDHVDRAHFVTNKDVEHMMHQIENIVTQDLEDGDRQSAMKLLRVPPKPKNFAPCNSFRIGFLFGYLIILLIAVVLSAIFYYDHSLRNDWKLAFKLYRGPFLLVEFLFIWSINLYAWRVFGVNHVLIFELDPRNYITAQHLLELGIVFGTFWCISVLGFIYSPLLRIPAFLNPLLLWIFMFAFLFNPTKSFYYKSRLWAIK